MITSNLLFIVLSLRQGPPTAAIPGFAWYNGNAVLVQHTNDYDISIADYRGRVALASVPLPSGLGYPMYQEATDRFVIVQSTKRKPGSDLDVVAVDFGGAHAPSFKAGARYLVVSAPQHNGKLSILGSAAEQPALLRVHATVKTSFPAPAPGDEMGLAILRTQAAGFDLSQPWEGLFLAAFDCMAYPDSVDMERAQWFIVGCGYPDPDPRNLSGNPTEIMAQYHPIPSELLDSIREKAQIWPPNVRAAAYLLMNSWGVKGLAKLELECLIQSAKDPQATIMDPGRWRDTPYERLTVEPKQAVDVLDTATNYGVIRYFLGVAPASMTMQQDRHLVKWLDSPIDDFRYFAASHFSRSRSRPDLKPEGYKYSRTLHTAGYRDLADKVAAWKAYFAKS